eukprot:4014807-Alexandrium_andersonii.AAC.1
MHQHRYRRPCPTPRRALAPMWTAGPEEQAKARALKDEIARLQAFLDTVMEASDHPPQDVANS